MASAHKPGPFGTGQESVRRAVPNRSGQMTLDPIRVKKLPRTVGALIDLLDTIETDPDLEEEPVSSA